MSKAIPSFDRRPLIAALFLALAALLFTLPPATAEARPLDAPRASGVVGERFDGYAMVRSGSASESIKKLVAQTNAQRRALYQKRAKETGASEADIGKIYAQQIMKSAPKGTWFLTPGGKWIKR